MDVQHGHLLPPLPCLKRLMTTLSLQNQTRQGLLPLAPLLQSPLLLVLLDRPLLSTPPLQLLTPLLLLPLEWPLLRLLPLPLLLLELPLLLAVLLLRLLLARAHHLQLCPAAL